MSDMNHFRAQGAQHRPSPQFTLNEALDDFNANALRYCVDPTETGEALLRAQGRDLVARDPGVISALRGRDREARRELIAKKWELVQQVLELRVERRQHADRMDADTLDLVCMRAQGSQDGGFDRAEYLRLARKRRMRLMSVSQYDIRVRMLMDQIGAIDEQLRVVISERESAALDVARALDAGDDDGARQALQALQTIEPLWRRVKREG